MTMLEMKDLKLSSLSHSALEEITSIFITLILNSISGSYVGHSELAVVNKEYNTISKQ
jgi:hypothetical protein